MRSQSELEHHQELGVMTIGNLEAFGGDSKADADGGPQSRWIRVSVEAFEHSALDDGPYDRRSAWLWLIAHACWKSTRVNHKGCPMTLDRGQILAGRAYLAQQWKWSEKKVRNFISLLLSEKMVKKGQSGGHYANVLTICNYNKFQSAPELSGQCEGQCEGQSGARAGPERGQTLTKGTNIPVSEGSEESEGKLASLNGATTEILASVQGWMNGGTITEAERWLAKTVSVYGGGATKGAYHKLVTDIAEGQVIARPLQTFAKIAERMKTQPTGQTRGPARSVREAIDMAMRAEGSQ